MVFALGLVAVRVFDGTRGVDRAGLHRGPVGGKRGAVGGGHGMKVAS